MHLIGQTVVSYILFALFLCDRTNKMAPARHARLVCWFVHQDKINCFPQREGVFEKMDLILGSFMKIGPLLFSLFLSPFLSLSLAEFAFL